MVKFRSFIRGVCSLTRPGARRVMLAEAETLVKPTNLPAMSHYCRADVYYTFFRQ